MGVNSFFLLFHSYLYISVLRYFCYEEEGAKKMSWCTFSKKKKLLAEGTSILDSTVVNITLPENTTNKYSS